MAGGGAYLGNRMANGSDEHNTPAHLNPDTSPTRLPNTDAAASTGSGGFPFLSNDAPTQDAGPDYFTDDLTSSDSGPNYFAPDDSPSSYDDLSSDDTGGSGFDDPNDNTGTW